MTRRRMPPEDFQPLDPLERGRKVNGYLRAGGFLIIVVAFLAVSPQFINRDDPTEEPATTPASATVIADERLRGLLPVLAPATNYRFVPAADLARTASGAADVVVAAETAPLDALAAERRCVKPVVWASKADPPTRYGYCLLARNGTPTDVQNSYLKALTGFTSRVRMVDAGFDVPQG